MVVVFVLVNLSGFNILEVMDVGILSVVVLLHWSCPEQVKGQKQST